MPDPYDRHRRPGKWGDYPSSQPPRSQQVAAAAQEHLIPEIIREGKRPPGKKDPDLCKGRHWKGPHTPEIELQANGWLAGRQKECHWDILGWRSERKPYWACRHVLICSGCGKDFGKCTVSQCPLYHAITKTEQAGLDEQIRLHDEWIAGMKPSRWRRKPVITGPQGYRKKR